MDDCVVDWFGAAIKIMSASNVPLPKIKKLDQVEFDIINKHHRFYHDLELMQGAVKLVNWAREFTTKNDMFLAFLTAIPPDGTVPFAAHDKVLWAAARFPDIPVFFGPYPKDKCKHCKPLDILIDDKIENCEDWVNAGGISHQYTTWDNCKKWIKSHNF